MVAVLVKLWLWWLWWWWVHVPAGSYWRTGDQSGRAANVGGVKDVQDLGTRETHETTRGCARSDWMHNGR
jgi:hypothetical protein